MCTKLHNYKIYNLNESALIILFSTDIAYKTISNIKRYRVGESKHNTLLRCKESPVRPGSLPFDSLHRDKHRILQIFATIAVCLVSMGQ